MRATIVTFALILAACDQSAAPPAVSEAPASEAVAPAPAALTGRFIAMSNTALALTGDVDVQADALGFSKGFRLEGGRVDDVLGPNTDYSAGGGTIADSSGVQNIESVELRRIEATRVAADAPAPQLCSDKPVSHAVLANNADTLSVLIFSGADAPGPNAHDSQLCGIFNYSTS
jgi:hypothetical protein